MLSLLGQSFAGGFEVALPSKHSAQLSITRRGAEHTPTGLPGAVREERH